MALFINFRNNWIITAIFISNRIIFSSKKNFNSITTKLHILVIVLSLALPIGVIKYTRPHPFSSLLLLFQACVLFLKLVSYVVVNKDYRLAYQAGKPITDDIKHIDLSEEINIKKYPDNLTIGNLLYFLFAPTLIYQLNYPRSPKIRYLWLGAKIVEWIFFTGLQLFILEQYIIPTVTNSKRPLDKMDWILIFERVLKLAIPNLYLWLIMFYCQFHVLLNILAEILRFGDREFYKDWWNARTIEHYWRTWNLPVHNWLHRYVYLPSLSYFGNKLPASIMTFFVSAVFHELLVSVPCHTLRLWAFFGMMGQMPLMIITYFCSKSLWIGNVVFWTSFCMLGQPLSILLYYHGVVSAGTSQ